MVGLYRFVVARIVLKLVFIGMQGIAKWCIEIGKSLVKLYIDRFEVAGIVLKLVFRDTFVVARNVLKLPFGGQCLLNSRQW